MFAPTNAAFQNAFAMLDTNLTDILYSGHLDALLQYHFLLKPYTVCLAVHVHARVTAGYGAAQNLHSLSLSPSLSLSLSCCSTQSALTFSPLFG